MLILDRMEGDDDSLQQHVCWNVNRVCVCVWVSIYMCVCACVHVWVGEGVCVRVCVGGGVTECVCVCVTISIFQVKEKLKS